MGQREKELLMDFTFRYSLCWCESTEIVISSPFYNLARHEALRMFRRYPQWTNPRWWQWWRWRDSRFTKEEVNRMKRFDHRRLPYPMKSRGRQVLFRFSKYPYFRIDFRHRSKSIQLGCLGLIRMDWYNHVDDPEMQKQFDHQSPYTYPLLFGWEMYDTRSKKKREDMPLAWRAKQRNCNLYPLDFFIRLKVERFHLLQTLLKHGE